MEGELGMPDSVDLLEALALRVSFVSSNERVFVLVTMKGKQFLQYCLAR